MIEIRFHGRGGQGVVVASKTLAVAYFLEGKYVQAFPAFGAERRGAPVVAFTRVDDVPIRLRNYIYAPDHIVVLDPTLLEMTNITDGLKKGGLILINIDEPPSTFSSYVDFRVATVDASGIAVEHGLGTPTAPIVNTAVLGAFARATASAGLDAIARAIEDSVPHHPEQNVAAARAAFHKVRIGS